ncbi:hypothetical protein SESBI_04032 [Sesbania bispinosa]|nr:hypothetical protein SESBI_04032 [Sesbania bispinosa]
MADTTLPTLMDVDRLVDDDPYLNIDLSDLDAPIKIKKKKNVSSCWSKKHKQAIDLAAMLKDHMDVDMSSVYDMDFDVDNPELGKLRHTNAKYDKVNVAATTTKKVIKDLSQKLIEDWGKLKTEKTAREKTEEKKDDLEEKLKGPLEANSKLKEQVSSIQANFSSADKTSKIEYVRKVVIKDTY